MIFIPILDSARGMKEFLETELWFEYKKARHSENPDTSVCVLSC